MDRLSPIIFALQILAALSAASLSLLFADASVVLAGIFAVGWTGTAIFRRATTDRLHLCGIAGVLVVSGCLFRHALSTGIFDAFHGIIAVLWGSVSVFAGLRTRSELRATWFKVAVYWTFFASVLFLIAGYSENSPATFYAGLLFTAVLCIAVQACFRPAFWVKQVATTLLLFVIALPLVNCAFDRNEKDMAAVDLSIRPYAFATSAGYPVIFKQWWLYYISQMEEMAKDVYLHDSTGTFPFLLRPGSTGELFGASVRINAKGFRGRDIPNTKDGVYRIVALGESTTFGLNLGTTPWPELLEKAIAEQFPDKQRVEVINAGIPSYTLKHNLARLHRDILPLKPDLILSYHGINGFPAIHKALPPMHGNLPPAYRERPLKLLADCEHRLKYLWHFRNHRASEENADIAVDSMSTEYAQHYRELISFARTNSIDLAISTFSMAVNKESPDDVVEFYRPAFPNVHLQMRANETHSDIVRRFSEKNPQLLLIDTHRGLDGAHEKFIDLIHFNEEGEVQMADSFFVGLKEFLDRKLSDRVTASNSQAAAAVPF